VVFADTASDPKFVQQMAMFEADPGSLDDRLVVVLTDTDPAANGPLRQRLRPRGFGLVLIDIDGRVAQRRPLPATVRELSNMIDRMPSRAGRKPARAAPEPLPTRRRRPCASRLSPSPPGSSRCPPPEPAARQRPVAQPVIATVDKIAACPRLHRRRVGR
jgi:hypothetical protein